MKEFGCPAGGCLLTDPIFAGKLRDLSGTTRSAPGRRGDAEDRPHFRLGEKQADRETEKEENERLAGLSRADGLLLKPLSFVGPSGLLIGETDEGLINISANMIASHAKNWSFPLTVELSNGTSARRVVERIAISRTNCGLIERRQAAITEDAPSILLSLLQEDVSYGKTMSYAMRPLGLSFWGDWGPIAL